MKWAMSTGINWNWFLGYTLEDDGTITVNHEGRVHKYDESERNHAFIGMSCDGDGLRVNYYMLETKTDYGGDQWPKREACGVRLFGHDYPLREPIFRFGFPDLPRRP